MLRKKSYGSAEIISIDRERLLSELREIAGRMKLLDPEILEVKLFGSLVRGDYTPESDLDLAVMCRDTTVRFLMRADAFRDLFLKLPFTVDIKVYTLEETKNMRESGNPLIHEIDQTGILLA